ncbi:MAG: hypothetical protein IKS43_07510 [Clostridia bacterium]|nr:hypothetical protein [Clostridia bacterium]
MAGYTYRIDAFMGLDQSRDESLISPSYTPDAMNMDTSDGCLAVTRGFSRYIAAPVPEESTSGIDCVCFFKSAAKKVPLAISGGFIYTYDHGSQEWTRAYAYPLVLQSRHYSTLMTRIGMTDTLLIADGANRILKFDGSDFSLFGSSEGCSDVTVSCVAMYRSRLFASGNYENPNRLYYSKLPGSGRTIEDWGPDEYSPSVEGGFVDVGTTSGDPITAICAISNQLLIFKKSSVYRLIGDRPGNFTVELIKSDSTFVTDTASAVWRDNIYYVTEGGLHCFNGVDAAPMPDARMIRRLMQGADTSDTRMATAGDRLYFTIKKDGESRLVEYDLVTRKYMQYGGFTLYDITAEEGELIITCGTRCLEIWGRGQDFDGTPISAYWQTPLTDLFDKAAIKTLRAAALRAESPSGGPLVLETEVGGVRDVYRAALPEGSADVLEIPLKNEGRTFRMRIRNETGGEFRIVGGIELDISVRRRTE